MLSFLPGFLMIPFSFTLYSLNLAFCGMIILFGGILKLLLPFSACHRVNYTVMHAVYRLWAIINFSIMRLTNPLQWEVEGDDKLDLKSWYLIIANHQSWIDILVISQFALFKIPAPKFFLKEELRWVPFIGTACWALDMPFMKRYSRQYLEKNPHLKGKDIETTKKSCEKFKDHPTSIINFVEGTRFTAEKHQKTGSKFRHLLAPKAGGIAFTLAAMGEQFDKVLNITILYPDNQGRVMFDLLSGNLKRIHIQVEQVEVTTDVIGDYFNDDSFKNRFQVWLNEKWQQKDKLIAQMLG
ncbi:acyltransferase [Flocculibacter collagenilyticus]|uniref:acyltransferase n=1 Tax=Flocculibacter collagenilyticus TaxID=2744479 RepID=UPI0018F75ED1|nr:acyltransferase [Flocculibacter collagenilyticus]